MSRRNPMPDFADAPIKLFGRSIQLPDSNSPPPAAAADSAELDASSSAETADCYAETGTEDSDNGTAGESHVENGKSLKKLPEHKDVKPIEQVAKCSQGNDEKVLKKPDKIVPCPRCHSMETKFCYFNNYNVNQPRHFCKSCQRYWTAGGTIRNVPIGAGRRKNKQILGSQFQPLPISPKGVSSGFAMETKEVVCQNGNDPPLCNSVATLLTLNDHNKAIDNSGQVDSSGSQMGQLDSSGSQMGQVGFPGPPAYPWSIAWTAGGHTVLVPWSFPPMVRPPGFCGPTSGVIPLIPPPYWNWDAANAFNLQTNNLSPSSSAGNSSCSGNTSPLGKHSRDLNSQGEEATEKCLWIPKTLRIDDPDEAAKSSIWTTLGIKPDDREPFSRGNKPLKDLHRKSEGDDLASDGDKTLHANPAALSRFKAFQEST